MLSLCCLNTQAAGCTAKGTDYVSKNVIEGSSTPLYSYVFALVT